MLKALTTWLPVGALGLAVGSVLARDSSERKRYCGHT